MPKKLVKQFAEKYNCEQLLNIQKIGLDFIKKNTDTTEIVAFSKNKINKIKFAYANCLGIDEILYSDEDYSKHLENTIEFADKNKNYHVFFQDNNAFENMVLYYKEDYGVILMKLELPCTTFLIKETNMVAAFGDYLNEQVMLLKNKSKSKS